MLMNVSKHVISVHSEDIGFFSAESFHQQKLIKVNRPKKRKSKMTTVERLGASRGALF